MTTGMALIMGREIVGDSASPWILTLFDIVGCIGFLLVIMGLCYYAKAKGQPGALGLLGLLSMVGVLILVCLKDKTEKSPLPPPST